MPIKSVSIDQIKIGPNRRSINGDKVEELKESIQANGLLNPITVDRKLNLIAGLHRLTACRLLGLEKIQCHVVDYEDADQARLAEIDENFIRNELKPLERAEMLLERQKILDRLGLMAKAGDNQHTLKTGRETISPPPKTNLEFAKEVGYSERSLQHDKQIAKDIHPEVKQKIKGTPIADVKTELLRIARAGSKERALAEQAEQALELAQAQTDKQLAQQQAKIAEQWRLRQQEAQLQAFKIAMAKREAKLAAKKAQPLVEQHQARKSTVVQGKKPWVNVGDEWMLNQQHLVYCGDTDSQQFMNLLPGNAALAIATLSPTWNHDYLVDEARVVAVVRSEGNIYNFCSRTRMPFQYELVLGNLYVGIFSRQSISKPQIPIHIEGVEGIVVYLLNMYTNPNNFVIAPFMGHGEILIACEKMGRTCFIGGENLELVSRGIIRWQEWSGKQAEKIGSS
ncbi:ParB N-terminal domain-containing protein [Brasilonema sp. UFV-L1]|uniref:ParB/RepB/Spo0J family partition protein n=1 Tax=Brasilonema sp. UFV-L1 TaxID=2234130 RepID=UPI00145D7A55|nr:ParB N-terminal domain-containing protein [Brasilonema sp. UFV-L1]NMG05890.1 chromosome partitioning protein ParB [Brasilonema sp. UFV-L1]